MLGFPLLTALALRDLPASHAAVVVGVIPAATAVAAVLRAGERPTRGFWVASGAGLVAVLAFAAAQGRGCPQEATCWCSPRSLLCALGYAEGAVLSRELGGWRVISWALLLALPVTLPATAVAAAGGLSRRRHDAWLAFAYVSAISMFLAFFAWYAGLARGGVAKIGQVQLSQPVLTLIVVGAAARRARSASARSSPRRRCWRACCSPSARASRVRRRRAGDRVRGCWRGRCGERGERDRCRRRRAVVSLALVEPGAA